ncbi:hypothetical protein K402DRAFT_389649 [Aulographum hederae CBS 113979]|uniref:N-acetyltransferase domain-containing protein n=1 Tax=Aulographum hederae CBS 113979 TaxID=1176131 RepID=A0A6G1HBX4_9PEZI|nr:hypothetical protein K402DRAFT_389649 [Aulographum hederae CBS 113979]
MARQHFLTLPDHLRTPVVAAVGVGDRIPSIPVFKTSAAFLTSLGANLRISDTYDDYYPSPISTPSLRASRHDSLLPPPSPFAFALSTAMSASNNAPDDHDDLPNEPIDPLADVPELSTFHATSRNDRVAGLKLVADSVAQQRQMASRVLIAHPLNLAVFAVVLAIVAKLVQGSRGWPLVVTTWAGVSMGGLALVRWMTSGYINLAEETQWLEWLGDDTIIVSKWGDEIIGACVVEWVSGDGNGKGNRRKKSMRAQIRAWTVRLKYRGKGIGTGLLEDAVEMVNKKGGDGLDFAYDHAHSDRILKEFYNKPFDRRDQRAYTALQKVTSEKGHFGRRR